MKPSPTDLLLEAVGAILLFALLFAFLWVTP
jgi:hypothetical protein